MKYTNCQIRRKGKEYQRYNLATKRVCLTQRFACNVCGLPIVYIKTTNFASEIQNKFNLKYCYYD